MNYRDFGFRNKKISEISFGTWGLGNNHSPGYGKTDDNESIKSLNLAFEKGINFYDTADLYGLGHSERIIAKALKKNRKSIFIASKGGTLPHKKLYMPQDFSKKYLNYALEQSLKRLETDYIDLYQLHSPKLEDIKNNDCFETLNEMISSGKILSFGVSVRSPLDAIELIEKYNVKYIQTNFNLLDQRALNCGLFNIAKQNGVHLIIRTPLVFGFLSNKKIDMNDLDITDHRRNYPIEQINIWMNASKKFKFLYENLTPSQAALRFCLDFDEISTVIPGMLTQDHVIENIYSSSVDSFSKSSHNKIKDIYKNTTLIDPSIKGKKDIKDE